MPADKRTRPAAARRRSPGGSLLAAIVASVCSIACAAPRPVAGDDRAGPPAGPGEVVEQAHSTIGWTGVPPFRRDGCGPDQVEGEVATDCFFFTRPGRPGQPWEVARFTGEYTLVGRWTGEQMIEAEWLAHQGLALHEGVDQATAYPVLEVSRSCIHPADAERHEALLDEWAGGDPAEAARARAWLRAERCPTPARATPARADP